MGLPLLAKLAIHLAVSYLLDLIFREPEYKTGSYQQSSGGSPSIKKGVPVPVVWGHCFITSPHLMAAVNMYINEIHQVGACLGFALCRGAIISANSDGLLMIRFGGKIPQWGVGAGWCHYGDVVQTYPAAINDNSLIEVHDSDLFVGTAYGGGIEMYGYFHLGADDEALDTVFKNKVGATWSPAWRGVVWCWLDGYLGRSYILPGVEFEIRRCPNNLSLTGDGHIIQDPTDDVPEGIYDANPAEILYELLTDDDIGLGLTTDDVSSSSFQTMGNALATEKFGMSLIWDGLSPIQNVVDEILKTIGAVLYQDSNGKIAIKLLRAADSSVLTLDEDNTISFEMEQSHWTAKADNIIVEYPLRAVAGDRITRGSVTANDPSRFAWGSGGITTKVQYEGIRRADLAEKLAVRDLRILTTPFKKFKAVVNREAYVVEPGDVINVTWTDYSLSALRCRVDAVDQGSLEDGAITLYLIEDVFDLTAAAFDSPKTEWTDDDAELDVVGYGYSYGNAYGGVTSGS